MNRPWKLVLLLVGIFAAGAVIGSLVTLRVVRTRVGNRMMPDRWAPMHLKRMAQELDLRPEQIEQIQPIVRRNMDELGRLRSKSMQDSRVVFDQMQREISEKLTPEQRARFEQMNREFRERLRRFSPERGGRPHSPPPDGAPPPERETGATPPKP